VLLGRASCLRRLGEPGRARRLLDDLLARHPDDAAALLERGQFALQDSAPAEAEPDLRRAAALVPYDVQTNYLLAQCLRQQARADEARDYEDAVRRHETELKRLEEAFRRVEKAPRDPEPRREAGLICLRNGREDEGVRWLFSALQQDPGHAATRTALADYYERRGRTDLALSYRRPPAPAGWLGPAGTPVRRGPG
jgi:Flp pilus assembly protein TadD